MADIDVVCNSPLVPSTWSVTACPDCHETWTIDTRDFDPPLSIHGCQQLLLPLLDEHRCQPSYITCCFFARSCGHVVTESTFDAAHAAMEAHYGDKHAADIARYVNDALRPGVRHG